MISTIKTIAPGARLVARISRLHATIFYAVAVGVVLAILL